MSPRVLVLGSGQLGLMLAEAGARLGVVVDRFDPESELVLPGTSDLGVELDPVTMQERYALITVEREHFPATPLCRQLLQSPKCSAYRALQRLSDRLDQKRLLDELELPQAPWIDSSLPDALNTARQNWGDVVIKARRGGYDGRGTQLVLSTEPMPTQGGDTIVEARVNFTRELSLVAARNARGDMACYPLVENWHHQGILHKTLAPAANVNDQKQCQAEAMAKTLMEALDYRGVMALELFDCGDSVLINEIAPRPHNSGHWTQDGANVCQFELHLRALCDLPLPTLRAQGATAMLNLIGVPFDRDWLQRPGHVHWYNKAVRQGRKQGHINLNAETASGLETQMQAWDDLKISAD